MLFSREHHQKWSHSRFYLAALGIAAYFLMLTGVLPFEMILLPASAETPRRWKQITLAGALGSALGAATVTLFIQHLGWPLVQSWFPHLAGSEGWTLTQNWVRHYGGLSLAPMAAIPMAQAPVLVVAGLFQISWWQVLLAFLIGKNIKYGILSIITIRSEHRLKAWKLHKKSHPDG